MTPECSCPLAGYCARHKIEKNEHWHRLCQKEAYRQAWDEGRGPGQKPQGLGDTVEKLLGPVGRAYKKLRGGKCGCNKRKELLNRIFPYAPPPPQRPRE